MRRELERFPRIAAGQDDVHPAALAALWPYLSTDSPYGDILILPSIERQELAHGWRSWLPFARYQTTPEHTLTVSRTHLAIASRAISGASVVLTTIPRQDILGVELGSILLRGWLKLIWASEAGPRQIELDFNTVGLRLVRGLISTIQLESTRTVPAARPGRADCRDQIAALPLKFRNILHIDALSAGERVLDLLFEPTVPPLWLFHVGGSEGKLWVATDSRFLLLREPPALFPYGWVIEFLSRDRATLLSAVENPRGIELQLCLGGAHVVTSTFRRERAAEVRAFAERWQQIRAAPVPG